MHSSSLDVGFRSLGAFVVADSAVPLVDVVVGLVSLRDFSSALFSVLGLVRFPLVGAKTSLFEEPWECDLPWETEVELARGLCVLGDFVPLLVVVPVISDNTAVPSRSLVLDLGLGFC